MIEVAAEHGHPDILTPEALDFVADLHRTFDPERRRLLEARSLRWERIAAGEDPGFLGDTADIRAGDWRVALPPDDLADRRCEITGPTDRKMVINALNSGARVFMADFEDSNSPTWANMVEGQANLYDAIRRRIDFVAPTGKEYRLDPEVATLMVRPRGWHLEERHVLIDGAPVAASLFDFGVCFFHNAAELIARGSGPYFYLPKLQSHHEARLWNDVFVFAQQQLGVPVGTIRATVLTEHVLAAFEMEEILYELRDHSAGLNAGRWDYIFSMIKTFRTRDGFVLPDRSQITMTVPFMRAYTELLVSTCHRRGAHAMGGMAAFIPSRKDPAINESAFAKVRADKERESADGCDGTWVAHPDLVPLATEVFTEVLGDRPNQIERLRDEVNVTAKELIDTAIEGGTVTDAGVRLNVDVAVRYLASWLAGNGAAAIYNLMEDAATAEISRSQIWQWVHNGVSTVEGTPVTADLVRSIVAGLDDRYGPARDLFEAVALADGFPEFLTLPGYEILLKEES